MNEIIITPMGLLLFLVCFMVLVILAIVFGTWFGEKIRTWRGKK